MAKSAKNWFRWVLLITCFFYTPFFACADDQHSGTPRTDWWNEGSAIGSWKSLPNPSREFADELAKKFESDALAVEPFPFHDALRIFAKFDVMEGEYVRELQGLSNRQILKTILNDFKGHDPVRRDFAAGLLAHYLCSKHNWNQIDELTRDPLFLMILTRLVGPDVKYWPGAMVVYQHMERLLDPPVVPTVLSTLYEVEAVTGKRTNDPETFSHALRTVPELANRVVVGHDGTALEHGFFPNDPTLKASSDPHIRRYGEIGITCLAIYQDLTFRLHHTH